MVVSMHLRLEVVGPSLPDDLKHLHNIEMQFYCPQTFLNLDSSVGMFGVEKTLHPNSVLRDGLQIQCATNCKQLSTLHV